MIPDRKTHPTSDPKWVVLETDDGSLTLLDPQSRVSFHSGCGAIAETRHVYLSNSGTLDRIERQLPTRVLEIGVGLGLGLLHTVDAACHHDTPLEYVGFESHWLTAEMLKQLKLDRGLNRPELADVFLNWRSSISPANDMHQFSFANHVNATVLTKRFEANQLQNVMTQLDLLGPFDAIYFDPFDPATQPDLWQAEVFSALCTVVAPEGRLVSYCCKRTVRDVLHDSGWNVDTVAGPVGGKREVLLATPAN